MSVRIDYLGHSGFFVETDRVMLLFDYFRGDLTFISERTEDKRLFVFASHAHRDHFNPEIFSVRDLHEDTEYLLSFDIEGDPSVPQDFRVRYLEADMTYDIEGLGTVSTLRSTDEGVAFLVMTGEKNLYHAGDLHWWDWPGEDQEWLDEQATVFRREIGKLEGTPIDVAFAVLDDRLEDNYAKGMQLFLSVCHPRYVLPMHFWNDRTVIERFRAIPGALPEGTVMLDTASETNWEID